MINVKDDNKTESDRVDKMVVNWPIIGTNANETDENRNRQ